jgi:hypothetical protein
MAPAVVVSNNSNEGSHLDQLIAQPGQKQLCQDSASQQERLTEGQPLYHVPTFSPTTGPTTAIVGVVEKEELPLQLHQYQGLIGALGSLGLLLEGSSLRSMHACRDMSSRLRYLLQPEKHYAPPAPDV